MIALLVHFSSASTETGRAVHISSTYNGSGFSILILQATAAITATIVTAAATTAAAAATTAALIAAAAVAAAAAAVAV